MKIPRAKLYMIGAGPGDPGLLTLKAHRLIISADVILHDDLVSDGIKELFPKTCLVYNVGKRYADGKDQRQRLEGIVELVLEHADPDKTVVRLKGGDPMIFSRSVEEIESLHSHNLEIEMVPGITSGVAAGNTSMLPLTERAVSEGIMFVTGSTLDYRVEHLESIVRWLMLGNTVLLYMGFKRFNKIRDIMYTYSLDPQMPACAVSNVSLPTEKYVLSTVQDVAVEAEKQNIQMPVVIVIGRRIRKL